MKSRMFKLTVAVMCVMLLCCSFAVSASAFSVFDIAEIFALDGSGEGTTEELSTLEITTEEGSVQEATTLEEPESTTEEETTEEASSELINTVISSVEVAGIDVPVVGAAPDFAATVSGEGYAVESIEWYALTDGFEVIVHDVDTFAACTKYRAYVTVCAQAGYEFSADVTATLNGKEATASPSTENSAVAVITADFFTCNPAPVAAVEADCTTNGKEAHYRCDTCGKCFEDAEATVEIGDIDTWGVIEATGHNNKKVTTKARRSADGKIENVCRTCGARETVKVISKPTTFTLSKTKYTYSGKVKTPKVTVKDENGETLTEGTDYTLEYSKGRKLVGEYSVKVVFKGNYVGSKTLKFTVRPNSTSVRELTRKPQGFIVKWRERTKQISGYQIEYSTSKSFPDSKSERKRITDRETVTKKITGLKAETRYYVRVRTYKTVDGERFYSKWSDYKYVKTQPAVKIRVTPYKKTLYIGDTLTGTLDIYPKDVTVKWKTSSSSVATVSSKGVITARKAGKATITAYFKYDGKTYEDTVAITVKTPSITLSQSTASAKVGATISLSATVNPAAGGYITWRTSDQFRATVDNTGKVTCKSAGVVTISATYTYKGYNYVKECKVTVIADPVASFNKLKNYIQTYGAVNEYGNKVITTGTYTVSSSNKYNKTYGISYNKNTGMFDFVAVVVGEYYPSNDVTLIFSIDPSTVTTSVTGTVIYYNTTGPYEGDIQGAGYATATLNVKTYTSNTNLDFVWHSESTSNVTTAAYEALLNETLDDAFSCWNRLMRDKCQISLIDLGFYAKY